MVNNRNGSARFVVTSHTGIVKTKMNRLHNGDLLRDEVVFKGKLEDLKDQIGGLQALLQGLIQCSKLNNLLQKIYELREELSELEQSLLQSHLKGCISPSIKVPEVVSLAVSKLSAKRHGAIIVLEQEDNLDDYFQGGESIDAVVSATLLQNIFYPGSPLHDGAVLISDTRILKARCFLPFAPNPLGLEALGLGTRHAAAIGLSQVSDALVIVVSEEKGWISLAIRGHLYANLGTFALLQRLEGSLEEPHR